LELQLFSGFLAKGGHVTRKRPAGQWMLNGPYLDRPKFALSELRERPRRPPGRGLHTFRYHAEMGRPPVQYRLLQLDERIDLPRRQAALDQSGAKLRERR
jgi:hypothetical protein